MEWEEFASHAPPDLDKAPIHERRSISSHTPTGHGAYDDEPFATEGLAYFWYQRAVYWKREFHRTEGTQQQMNFEEPNVAGMTTQQWKDVRVYIKLQRHIDAIKFVRECTNLGLKESKDICDKLRADMGWNGKFGENYGFDNLN